MSIHKALRHLLIVGAGGSGREVAWLARDIHGDDVDLTFAVDREYYVSGSVVDDIRVVSMDSLPADVTHFVVAIGDLQGRRRLAKECEAQGFIPITLVHPTVSKSPRVDIGVGSVVYAGVTITTNVRVGRYTQINVGSTLSHDVLLGDFVTLSPGTHIAGHVHVEDDVFFGTGSNVINGTLENPLVIGRGAVVAAGACVIGGVDSGAMMVGVPATRRR